MTFIVSEKRNSYFIMTIFFCVWIIQMGGVKVVILYSSGLLIGCHIQNKTRDKRRHENNLSFWEKQPTSHRSNCCSFSVDPLSAAVRHEHASRQLLSSAHFFPLCHFKRRVKTTDAHAHHRQHRL